MNGVDVVQLSAVLIAVCTPWIVASVALRVATARDAAPHIHSLKLLRAMTVGGAMVVSTAKVILGPSPWMLLIAGIGFGAAAIGALRVLNEIDNLTRPARQVSSTERAASLRPRKPGEYLPWAWRLSACGAAILGFTAFVVRASSVDIDGRMLVPFVFAGAAVVFLGLYEVWAYQVITGPVVDGDADGLRRVVRRIFAMELLLVVACLGTAHALLDVNWAANGTLAAAIALTGSIVAIVGCALALTSGLVGRRYEAVER